MIKKLGQQGEEFAEDYLKRKGYIIKQKNYHTRFGEIDIIAVDPHERQLVFIEVKTRKNEKYGEPNESVTPQKISRLLQTALHFLNNAMQNKYISWRMDLITLKLDCEKGLIEIKHYKNILNEY